MEFGVLPTKVLKKDKSEYIQALIDNRKKENINIFLDCINKLHCQHIQKDIKQFANSVKEKMVDKLTTQKEMVDK